MESTTRLGSAQTVAPGRARDRATVVIADTGTNAQVVVFEPEHGLGVGSSFDYRGLRWRITGRRPHGGALVAEPVEV